MSEEKPLHVQVADALLFPETSRCLVRDAQREDWHFPLPVESDSALAKLPYCGNGGAAVRYRLVPRYDIDWSVTGPLIERHEIQLTRRQAGILWEAWRWVRPNDPFPIKRYEGKTPLIAACHAFVGLAASGGL